MKKHIVVTYKLYDLITNQLGTLLYAEVFDDAEELAQFQKAFLEKGKLVYPVNIHHITV